MKHLGALTFALTVLVRGLTGHADRINESEVESLEVMKPWTDFWLVRLIMNLFGYATVLIPGFIIIVYVRRTNYLDQPGSGYIRKLIRLLVDGSTSDRFSSEKLNPEVTHKQQLPPERSFFQQSLLLLFCSGGLLVSYLIWGILQERVMVYRYRESSDDPGELFTNSQFIVFMNRILALVIACIAMLFVKQKPHEAPLYKYSYSSLSNIMSSWCQYEALKFVSFPVQVLAKASKVIPVMLMGKVVSHRTYTIFEYVTAVMISAGLFLFLLTNEDSVRGRGKVTTISGIVILVGYLVFDAFTSNWQDQLFKTYRMSSLQMMAGVNLFSVLLTSVSLFEQGSFQEAAAFMQRHPKFGLHTLVLSSTSAVGQLFIYYTISEFGPVTFTIIMTIRMGLAILLSCIIYNHPVVLVGAGGICIVFAGVFLRVYHSWQKKSSAK